VPPVSDTIAKIISETVEKPLFREFQLTKENRAAINVEKRTVELSFASETPVERWYGLEVLDCSSPDACDLTRLRASGPLLVNHDPEDQVGVIDTCAMDAGKGRAVVRFGQSVRAKEIFQDVVDGIRSLVSVGYRVREAALMSKSDKVETYRATKWEPLEISIVSIPADTSVGVGRSEHQSNPQMKFNKPLLDATPAPDTRGGGATPAPAPATPAPNVVEIEGRGVTAERQRVKTLTNLATRYKVQDLLGEAIDKGHTEDQFRQVILERQHPGAKPLGEAEAKPEIGMDAGEVRSYSIVKAIRECALSKGGLTGLERDAHESAQKTLKRQMTENGFIIPHEVATAGFRRNIQAELLALQIRALSAGSNAAGGFSVGTNLMSGSLIELLRNSTCIDQAGATTLSGLVGNVAIPKMAGGATAYWLPESGAVTASDQSFGQLALTPHRLAADTLYSKELVMQSSIDIEGMVRNDIAKVMAIERDRAALHGLNAAGEPLGIFNTTGLSTAVTFGAAATWAKILSFETNLATSNALLGNPVFITTPAVRGKWKNAVRFANTQTPLWADDNTVNGYKAIATNQVASDKVVFGNFGDLIVADWAGIDVVVDPYSSKKNGQIEVTVTIWTDIGIRHPVSFCVSTDSGAQ
jgi:HK97 family phage major capsid protein